MNVLKNLSIVTAGAAFIVQLHSIEAEAATINQVAPAELTVTGLLTFDDDVAGGAPPGSNYDEIFESNRANFAERFVGQTLSFDGDFDILSGTPTGQLALQAGNPGQNLNIFANDETLNTNALTGLGPVEFPEQDAIGEGSIAILFGFDQSELGFDLVGSDGGSATVSFFRRNGSLIDTIVLDGLNKTSYGFSRDGGIKDIAGLSIYNTDEAGIGLDNLRNDGSGVPSEPPPSPDGSGVPSEPPPSPDGSGVPSEPPPSPDGSGVPSEPPPSPDGSGVPSEPPPSSEVPNVPSEPPPSSEVPNVPSEPPPSSEVPNVPSEPPPSSEVPNVPSEPTPIPFEFSPGLGILVLGAWGLAARLKSLVQKRKSSGSGFSNK